MSINPELQSALKNQKASRHSKAVSELRTIIDNDATNGVIYLALAKSLRELAWWPEAEEAAKSAFDHGAEPIESLHLLGTIYLRQKKLVEAESLGRQFITQYPNSIDPYVLLASVSDFKKEWNIAEALTHQALALSPNDAKLWRGLSVMQRNLKHWTDAWRSATRAYKLAPDFESIATIIWVILAKYRAAIALISGVAALISLLLPWQWGILFLIFAILLPCFMLIYAIHHKNKHEIRRALIFLTIILVGFVFVHLSYI